MGLLATLLSACSGANLIDALTPRSGYRLVSDIPYGEGPRRTLDIYVPTRPLTGPVPVIVFFYGGRWDSGSKDVYRFVAQAFTSRGYAVVIPDYRLYPEVRFPEFIRDSAAAVAWTHAHAAEHVPNAGPLVLAGHSAGAHIAALLHLHPTWLAADVRDAIAAAVGMSGPYDFLPITDRTALEVFGPGPAGPDTQPITFVDGSAAPMLLIHARNDTTVRPYNTEHLAARIREGGGIAEERYHDRLAHVGVVAALAAPLRTLIPILDEIDSFLRRHTAPSALR